MLETFRSERLRLSIVAALLGFGLVRWVVAWVPLALDRLVRPGILPLAEMVAKLTWNPARVLIGDGRAGVDPGTGTLRPGAPADVTLLALDRRVRVEPERLYTKSKNTPFAGWELTGAPVTTVVAGRVVMRDGVVGETVLRS